MHKQPSELALSLTFLFRVTVFEHIAIVEASIVLKLPNTRDLALDINTELVPLNDKGLEFASKTDMVASPDEQDISEIGGVQEKKLLLLAPIIKQLLSTAKFPRERKLIAPAVTEDTFKVDPLSMLILEIYLASFKSAFVTMLP